MTKLAFIGTGNMGGALALAAAKKEDNRLYLANKTPEKAEKLAARIGLAATATDSLSAASAARFIFLGVKPHMMADLLRELAPALAENKEAVLVTMAAGRDIKFIEDHAVIGTDCKCGGDAANGPRAVIRIMPNTPVAVGEGIVLYCCNEAVTKEQKAAFLEAMSESGLFIELEERLIDAGSALSGCGPAFAAMFTEALADGAVACGLPRKAALTMASQMLLGSARLALETGDHPGALKDAVCSPGGTTIEGVRTLEQNGFRGAVMDAVIAAFEKNKRV